VAARIADLDVFGLCLGGNVFGWVLGGDASFAVLDAYAAAGGNFIDTADLYGGGESEAIIGRWMAARGNRDEMIIATKVGMRRDAHGLGAENIQRQAEASLRQLQTDRIDLYYAHRDDPDTSQEETLAAFDALVREGKVRHVGASNFTAERLDAALAISARDGLAAYVALQPHYNLIERDHYEGALRQTCERHGIACLPYYGLAGGFLTGKYRPGGPEIDSPRAVGVRERYANDRGWALLAALDRVAGAHGASVAAAALAWLREQPTIAAPIASATSPTQVSEIVASATLSLTGEELRALSA
jgi:aryl-alcohol dehydrogenase-like predicted oxidoreductase